MKVDSQSINNELSKCMSKQLCCDSSSLDVTFKRLLSNTFKNIAVKSGLTVTFRNVRGNFGCGNMGQCILLIQNTICCGPGCSWYSLPDLLSADRF